MRNFHLGVFRLLFPASQDNSGLGLFPSAWSYQFNFVAMIFNKIKAAKEAARERKREEREKRAEEEAADSHDTDGSGQDGHSHDGHSHDGHSHDDGHAHDHDMSDGGEDHSGSGHDHASDDDDAHDHDAHDHDDHAHDPDMSGDGDDHGGPEHDHASDDSEHMGAGDDHASHDDSDDTGGDHDHTGHDHGSTDTEDFIPLPTHPGEVEAYVIAVKAEGDHAAHMDDSHKATEHGQLLDLVPRSEATHIAIGNGDWFDPDTWYNGEIPDAGAKVLIPKGVSVKYDGVSDASLFTVRVDGELSFAHDTDTKMVVDTFVVAPSGRLEIGTEDRPIQDDVTAEIVIANNGDIDVGWDPSLLSRGVISHGQVEIHGAEKTSNLEIVDAAMAGDTEIKLSDIPDNWQVGDTIVITGTHKQGWFYNNKTGQREFAESQDEEVTIVAINGDTITIDRPLEYDHDTPRDDLYAMAANMTRNITFRSEDGDQSEVHHRGHVMFMHNQDVDVRYAAFEDLGRTDKSNPAHHLNTLDPNDIQSDTNSQGRYAFHFHRTGTEDQDDPAIALGNVVDGSPGWGFVHHSSHANFVDNIAFDVFGASFVAEDGDETGIWWRNVAIKTEGIGYGSDKTKSGRDVARDDVGRTGDGFFFSGRLVEAAENVAANTTHGFVWMTRTSAGNPDVDHTDIPDAYYGREYARATDWVPIQGFSDNVAYGTQVGLIVVKRAIEQNHDVRSVLDGFLNWETSTGVDLTYTSHYTLKNIDLIGTDNPLPVANADKGFQFGAQVFDIVVNDLKVSNFKVGVDLVQFVKKTWTDEDIDHVLIDVELSNNDVDYRGFDSDRHTILSSDDLIEGQLEFRFTGESSIGLYQGIAFDGIKTDSIGSRDRQFASDEQKITFGKNILKILQTDGYYKAEDGSNIMILEDVIADRATGELSKIAHIITLDITDSQLADLGVSLNGIFDADSVAPEVHDDRVTVDNDSSVVIDVLANDFDADGDILAVDAFTNPSKGDLSLRDDGKLIYTPYDDYEGTDTFDYWATDAHGHFMRGTVTVDVFDMI